MEADWEGVIRKATGESVESSVLEVREHDIKRKRLRKMRELINILNYALGKELEKGEN